MARNVKPEYPKGEINRAGENIRLESQSDLDLKIVENWRAAHNKVLNDWQATLRGRCKGNDIIFAQRLKRRATIFNKLSREQGMQLSRMHDIAGCRLIFKTIQELNDFRGRLHKSWMKHKRRKSNDSPYPYDYIDNPKPSGYRGVHDVYEYFARPKRDSSWNGLMLEIQYRTLYQHAWATSVEVAGAVTGNHTKFDEGDEKQKEFFRITSEIIARAHEGLSSCCAHLSDEELVKLFKSIESQTHLLEKLKRLKLLGKHIELDSKNAVLVYSGTNAETEIYSFDSLPAATAHYFALEKIYGLEKDIVLVRAASSEGLRLAYKNYFSDTQDFVKLVEEGVAILSVKRS